MKKNIKPMIAGMLILITASSCKAKSAQTQQLTCVSGDSKDKFVQVYHYKGDELSDITLNLVSDYTKESDESYKQTLASLKSLAIKQGQIEGVKESIAAEGKNINQTIKVSMSQYDKENDALGLFPSSTKDARAEYLSAELEKGGFSCDITDAG
ncbi:hypothetical protein MKA27_17505 [[Clostridium] innocuum]|uniref:hypothetical protein n=1 Tax=Clostridium innocuum TaxID=1522 RepID=UPI000D6D6B6F|nr:hypothetical protein [[Clostridium] innocuum]MCR0315862.1 hypothetical protein [[Clostridium] innocuum]MCR0370937.1 hypothetical protein [[Clostridium] innocuum]MCR0375609.1 hypothetical protein [[Clostridium] innocuum]MCR0560913.1 hypothetical protein [[Clostridium] innocuum]MCR0603687.1 hypothetical protein [[Clostridium] innocuum]